MNNKPPHEIILPDTPEQRAYKAWALKALQAISDRAGPFADEAASRQWHWDYMAPDSVRAWLLQEMQKAFDHNASTDEFARWAYTEIVLFKGKVQ